MISLAQLCGSLGGSLRPATGTEPARRQISGVHISELEDPTPYLEGGELLLTTGIPVSGSAENVLRYVRRLVERNIAALGLGLGAGIDVVPGALTAACETEGMPLLVVPAGTPFMTVSRAYWDLMARGGQADLAASLGTQTALARAATRPDALISVVKALAQALGGWVVYLPSPDGPATIWPATALGVVPQLRQETSRLNMATTYSAATFALHGTDVVEYPVLVGQQIAGFLAIGAVRKLTKADRQVILTVCVLLSLKAQQELEMASTRAALGAAVAKMILKGHVEAGRALAADLGMAPPPEQVRLLVIRAGPDAFDGSGSSDVVASAGNPVASAGAPAGFAGALNIPGTLDGLASLAQGDPWSGLIPAVRASGLGYTSGGLTVLILDAEPPWSSAAETTVEGDAGPAWRGPEAASDSTAGRRRQLQPGSAANSWGPNASARLTPRALPADLAAALSRPMSLHRASDNIAELTDAARRADAGQLVGAGSTPADRQAEQWVAQLRAYPRADLVETVRSYLRHRGQWEVTARALGVHRNSLRHRIAIAAGLLNADLDDPDVAANLWLSLRAVPGPAGR
ncbi:PucR family transcriptional regulator [Paenarthrobacter sp. PH39-S1]|uniref:PucR family transcriptional regulator n=1 Tax=Paenarthrobacter sp. PH39-S1 TaxID=3046204 RepID=UPI0024B969B1|nr:PucR family transcriptional regulator [Paenarthrobacter sp. PH39-S1]MDJ0357089.1 PucR family transcriptional regulator [Paenarthrobacter sp. PH39-S1]